MKRATARVQEGTWVDCNVGPCVGVSICVLGRGAKSMEMFGFGDIGAHHLNDVVKDGLTQRVLVVDHYFYH